MSSRGYYVKMAVTKKKTQNSSSLNQHSLIRGAIFKVLIGTLQKIINRDTEEILLLLFPKQTVFL